MPRLWTNLMNFPLKFVQLFPLPCEQEVSPGRTLPPEPTFCPRGPAVTSTQSAWLMPTTSPLCLLLPVRLLTTAHLWVPPGLPWLPCDWGSRSGSFLGGGPTFQAPGDRVWAQCLQDGAGGER